MLNCPEFKNELIFHYTSSDDPKMISNAVTLICCFQVVILKRSAEKAWEGFMKYESRLKGFRDASQGPCTYKMKAFEVVKGLEIAIKLGWYDFAKFNHLEYEYFERVQNGDLNWIIPGKFVAFMGPCGRKRKAGDPYKTTPEDYVKTFDKWGVRHVVRLNQE